MHKSRPRGWASVFVNSFGTRAWRMEVLDPGKRQKSDENQLLAGVSGGATEQELVRRF